MDTSVKMKYPNLKYVNFYTDGKTHKDHIHISFAADRGGKYLGTDALTVSATADSTNSDSEDFTEASQQAVEKSKQNFKNKPSEKFSRFELFSVLREKFFSDEVAAIFTAVAIRESNGRPGSFNGKCKVNSSGGWGGDYSIGMFQFNLISYMKRSTNSSTDIKIYYDGTQVLTKPKEIPAAYLAYAPAEEQKWTSNRTGQKMVALQNEGKAYTSDLLWYPINQVALAAVYKFSYRASPIDDSRGFYAWGDYNNSDGSPRSDCGFIFGTKFQDAVSVYLTTGKDIAVLQEWVRKKLPDQNPRTKNYIEQWMQGAVLYAHPVNGSMVSSSKPISYKADSAGSGSGSETIKQIDQKLLIVGDYPVEQIAEALSAKMPKTPWKNYKIEGKRGRTVTTTAQTTTIKSLVKIIEDYKNSDFKPDAYIILCGNTNMFLGGSGYSSLIDRVKVAVGDKKVYWFNIYNKSNESDISRSILFNLALDTARGKYSNFLSNDILDWDSSIISNPSYLSDTGRSLSETGIAYLSSLVQQAANNMAALIQPGSYTGGTTTVPTFTSTQIVDAALWLLENRARPWSTKYGTLGCEFFANRFSSGLGILGATKKYDIFTNDWEEDVATTLATNPSAQSHYNSIKSKATFYGPSTDKGQNPPYGYLVFWTGGKGDVLNLGHIGISVGSGNYIDQTGEVRPISGSTGPGGYPGTDYVYVGSSSSWA